MGRTAPSRSIRPTAAVRPLLLAGTGALAGDLASHFRATFGTALTVTHCPAFAEAFATASAAHSSDLTTALAVGLFPVADRIAHREFARETRASQIPALSVAVEADATLIGPLAHPARAGCGHCARLRMIAAAAARRVDLAAEAAPQTWPTHALRRLCAEVRAALRTGPPLARRLDRHVLALDHHTPAMSRHRVVPMPYCDVCGGAAAITGERPTRGLAGWVDPRTGVITGLTVESTADTGLVSPIVVTAAPPHVVEPDGQIRRLPIGWGKGFTPADAVLSAVGEAIERYAASVPDLSTCVVARAADLDGPRLDPSSFALYSPEQYARDGFPFAPYDPDVAHSWVRGWWLGSREPVWVPAIFVFLSIDVRRDQLIAQGSSNGLAASTSIADASLRATMELVERDALMHAWMTATPGRRLQIDEDLDPQLQAIISGIESQGAAVEIYVLDTSVCGTTVLCISLGDGRRWPGVTLAMGADINPRHAVRQAILELGQTGPHLRKLLQNDMWPIPHDASAVREMLDHAAYYFPSERRAAFDRLRHGGVPVLLSELAVPRQSADVVCRSALSAAGVRVAIVDVTSPDVRTGPFRVARAISPDLQGISHGFALDRLPVPRIDRRRAVDVPLHPIW